MDTTTRREHIRKDLNKVTEPISASKLSKKYHVSRQVIVGDIAILKAQGVPVMSTARGYLMLKEGSVNEYIIACIHTKEETEAELKIIVDQGAIVKDIILEHPLYGDLNGRLDIGSRYDVEQFVEKSKDNNAILLSEMNNGIHLHTLICSSKEQFERVKAKLKEHGYLYE